MNAQKVDEVFQVNVYVKDFQRQISIICEQIILAYSEMGFKDYWLDNQ